MVERPAQRSARFVRVRLAAGQVGRGTPQYGNDRPEFFFERTVLRVQTCHLQVFQMGFGPAQERQQAVLGPLRFGSEPAPCFRHTASLLHYRTK